MKRVRPAGGWTERDVEMLMERTGAELEEVLRFCEAVDRKLYLMLPVEMKRATLYFHLGRPEESQSEGQET